MPGPVLALIGFIGLCLLVSAADGAVTSASLRTWYLSLNAPPGAPPGWIFRPIWAALHILVGIAGWLVWRRTGRAAPLRLWGWQLLLNALWAPAFLGLHNPALGLCMVLALLALTALTIRAFRPISRPATALMLPYVAWVCFLAYVNAGFWWLNR